MHGHVYVAAFTTETICEWTLNCMRQQEKWMMTWRKEVQEN